jgi:glutathione synthase/RimK-type ligase-like ATP-grasp enzyme
MSIHAKALKQACSELQLPYHSVGKSGVFLGVKIKEKTHYFVANHVPLNSAMTMMISEDKGHTYDLLKDVISMPQTLSFLDPHARELFQPYITQKNLEEIAEASEAIFNYPMVIKKNTGSQGENVFKCTNREEAIAALAKIYDHHTAEYDHVALVQEYVDIEKEYRVTVLDKKIELIYQKDHSNATFVGNLSPLHWEGAKAVLMEDVQLFEQIKSFIAPIFSVLDLVYGGLDIAIDKQGKMWLFEINTGPAYDHFVQGTNQDILVNLYKKILNLLTK